MFGDNQLKNRHTSYKLKLKNLSNFPSPFEFFSKIYKRYDYSYLLESVEGPKKLVHYSFIGLDPELVFTIKNGKMVIKAGREYVLSEENVIDPLSRIKQFLRNNSLPYSGLRFNGGAVGYVSYDAVRYWEKLPEIAIDDLNFPDIEMAIYNDGLMFDHEKKKVFYYYSREDRSKELDVLLKENVDLQSLKSVQLKTNFSKDSFEESVVKAKEYIASGDILQVVLSKRHEFKIIGDLVFFYKSLRRINPSPYMYFLKMMDRQIIGSSPEMLLRVENRCVETFPIAGTRPCVKDVNTNKALARELLSDPKEQAEHLMLVDLARNDIGRISKFGSVQVPQFMKIHEYSHVQHIVSRVVGILRQEYDSYDALKAVFPAGTVSGAPKVRAMEIIDESEPTRRAPYAGAIGYFSFNGNSDFAITIRTLVATGDRAYIQVGAGIVADSIPENEWFETDYKAKALINAFRKSGEN
jgi:anthranilate synthase component 1